MSAGTPRAFDVPSGRWAPFATCPTGITIGILTGRPPDGVGHGRRPTLADAEVRVTRAVGERPAFRNHANVRPSVRPSNGDVPVLGQDGRGSSPVGRSGTARDGANGQLSVSFADNITPDTTVQLTLVRRLTSW